jgi:hypothetical protein
LFRDFQFIGIAESVKSIDLVVVGNLKRIFLDAFVVLYYLNISNEQVMIGEHQLGRI